MRIKNNSGKTTAKKNAVKRTTPKTAARKVASLPTMNMGRSGAASVPSGHKRTPAGILVPDSMTPKQTSGVVPASKLEKGIANARAKISGVLEELVEATRENYEITEIELSASFNAEGKFLGFGVGGEMSVTFRVRPVGA